MITPKTGRRRECRGSSLRRAAFKVLILTFAASPLMASDLEMTGFRLVQGSDGGRWEITSGSARYDGENRVLLKEVGARQIGAPEGNFSINGQRGVYLSDREELTVESDVVARTGRGYIFRAPKVKWLGKHSQVHATGGILLTADGVNINGRKLVYDLVLRQSLILGSTVTRWRLREAAP